MTAESEFLHDDRNRRALDRVVFLSDGVFAIALTLLVLDLRLPPLAGHSESALGQALAADAPRFVAFVISFEVIGIFWLAHLRLFSVIARYDRGLAFINLLFLMSIAVMPFSTTLVSEYGDLTIAAAFYSGTLVLTSVTSNVIWWYAARRGRLLDSHASHADVLVITTRSVLTLILFVLSFGLAFVSVRLSQITWVLVAVVTPIGERVARRRSSRGRRGRPSDSAKATSDKSGRPDA